MENTDKDKIPFDVIRHHLDRLGRKVPWLAEKIGVDKNAIYNWPARGGVPMQNLHAIAAAFGVSPSALLGENNSSEISIRGQKKALSKTAEALIFSIIKLDGAGGQFQDILTSHQALMAFAEKSLPEQDASYEQNAKETVRLLQALIDSSGETNERSG